MFQIEDRGSNILEKGIAFISCSEDGDGMLF